MDDAFHLLAGNAAFLQDSLSLLLGELAEILFAWRDDETRHIEGSRRNHDLGIALGKVGFRAVLLSWNHDTDSFITLAPGHDVHHRLSLVAALRHRTVEALEEHLVAFLALGDDHEGWNGIVADGCYLLLVVQADDICQVA